MSRKRALIVDDSSTAQYRLKKMLQAYDLEIDVVDSGEAALLYLAKHVPDVVFMDHLMPGMDGFRALQIIKSHPETAMIPVIMYTSKSGDVYTGQARALGALDVITKDTINSVELSKVMRGIRIDPRLAAVPEETPVKTPAPVSVAATPAAEADSITAQAARQLAADNSRRVELRIVQLEHAIDDSRRVIAAQLIREMQKQRHDIKHELNKILGARAEQPAPEAGPAVTTLPPEKSAGAGSFIRTVLLLLLIIIAVGYALTANRQLKTLSAQQTLQHEQLSLVVNALLDMQVEQVSQLQRQSNAQVASAVSYPATPAQIIDFVWAFNQSSLLPYSSRLMEPNIPVRLNEFVNRLDQQGFTGTLWVNYSAGNFCVMLDSYGQALLPAGAVSVSECMLFSELYPLETMIEQALADIQASIMRVEAVTNGTMTVVVNRIVNSFLPYPARESQLPASDWNKIAQSNNRLTVTLSPPPQEALLVAD